MTREIQKLNFCMLTADDDLDDHYIIKREFTSVDLNKTLQTVSEGMKLIDYLMDAFKHYSSN